MPIHELPNLLKMYTLGDAAADFRPMDWKSLPVGDNVSRMRTIQPVIWRVWREEMSS